MLGQGPVIENHIPLRKSPTFTLILRMQIMQAPLLWIWGMRAPLVEAKKRLVLEAHSQHSPGTRTISPDTPTWAQSSSLSPNIDGIQSCIGGFHSVSFPGSMPIQVAITALCGTNLFKVLMFRIQSMESLWASV
jgi:hypothetical protein